MARGRGLRIGGTIPPMRLSLELGRCECLDHCCRRRSKSARICSHLATIAQESSCKLILFQSLSLTIVLSGRRLRAQLGSPNDTWGSKNHLGRAAEICWITLNHPIKASPNGHS